MLKGYIWIYIRTENFLIVIIKQNNLISQLPSTGVHLWASAEPYVSVENGEVLSSTSGPKGLEIENS